MEKVEERYTRWRKLLAAQRASGLSIAGWCAREGIRANVYYNWRKKLSAVDHDGHGGSARSCAAHPAPQWLAVEPEPAIPGPAFSSAGLTLRIGAVAIDVAAGFDPVLLAAVLTVLEPSRC
jgi:hypothetical protein